MTLAAAALLLSGFSIATARAEGPAVPKRSAYPELQDKPSTSNKPGMTADEKEKLILGSRWNSLYRERLRSVMRRLGYRRSPAARHTG